MAGLPAAPAGMAIGPAGGPAVLSFLDLVRALMAQADPTAQAGGAVPPTALLATPDEDAAAGEGAPGGINTSGTGLAEVLSFLPPSAPPVTAPPPGATGQPVADTSSRKADEAPGEGFATPAGIAVDRQKLPFPALAGQTRLTTEEPVLPPLSGPAPGDSAAGAPAPAQQALVAAPGPERVAEALPRAGEAAQSAGPRIAAPLNSRDWSTEFAQRVTWLVGQRAQIAEIAVNPPNLGGVEVRLSLSEHGAGAQFYSPHASVRDALEAALPRLRDMLAEAGIALGQAEVRDQAFAPRQQWLGELAGEGAGGTGGGPALPGPTAPARHGVGLIDLYA